MTEEKYDGNEATIIIFHDINLSKKARVIVEQKMKDGSVISAVYYLKKVY